MARGEGQRVVLQCSGHAPARKNLQVIPATCWNLMGVNCGDSLRRKNANVAGPFLV